VGTGPQPAQVIGDAPSAARRTAPSLGDMVQPSVWAQVTATGEVTTWHLGGLPGETRCGMPTETMRDLPKAEWELVLRPCLECQRYADVSSLPAARTA
jgi:hypothetical protein